MYTPGSQRGYTQPNSARMTPTMPESPARVATLGLNVTPDVHHLHDWEGYSRTHGDLEQARAAANSNSAANRRLPPKQQLDRSSSPSVAVFSPAVQKANVVMKRVLNDRSRQPHDTNAHMVDHQAYLQWRRTEYQQRLAAEARGEDYTNRRPYSSDFTETLPGGSRDPPSFISIDFVNRSRKLFSKPQVVGTKEEVAWLQPPEIPQPVGWNGFWDLCAGHELILQLMAVSGANAENSPSLTQHFMYPELLSCIQRLQYGAYLVHYPKNDTPHERYFYVKPLPLANRGQYCPFLCWSVHRHAHDALDAIPLCNVMWVTQGVLTQPLQKAYLGGDYISGPFVGKARAELLTHGVFTVWVYDGQSTKGINLCATDPLVFAMFMKLLEDVAQLNAALDVTGSVRALQEDLERLREEGGLMERDGVAKRTKSSLFGK